MSRHKTRNLEDIELFGIVLSLMGYDELLIGVSIPISKMWEGLKKQANEKECKWTTKKWLCQVEFCV